MQEGKGRGGATISPWIGGGGAQLQSVCCLYYTITPWAHQECGTPSLLSLGTIYQLDFNASYNS